MGNKTQRFNGRASQWFWLGRVGGNLRRFAQEGFQPPAPIDGGQRCAGLFQPFAQRSCQREDHGFILDVRQRGDGARHVGRTILRADDDDELTEEFAIFGAGAGGKCREQLAAAVRRGAQDRGADP